MFSLLEDKILGMSQIDYQVLFGVMLAFSLFLIVFGIYAFRRVRFMDATATSKIRSAAQGHVELKGLGEFMQNDVIVSPFSGERCLWYHCTMDKRSRKRPGKNTTWTNISDEISEHLFRLVDDTGECFVDPDRARVIPEVEQTWMGHGPDYRDRRESKSSLIRFSGSANYRFRERLIRPATSLYALGWFHTVHSNPSDEYVAQQVDGLVKQWKLQPHRYLADFDLDQNCKIQKSEWKVVRAAARKQVLAQIREQKSEHHVLKKPPQKDHPYIISAIDEENLVARKKIRGYASLSGACFLFIAMVFMWSIRLPFAI